MKLPEDLRYTASHEWVRFDGPVAQVGITDHAQQELSDVVFVELPSVGATFKAGDKAAVVESVKAASDIYAPVSGEVVAVNDALPDDPAQINSAPYDAWMFKIRATAPVEQNDLLTHQQYAASLP